MRNKILFKGSSHTIGKGLQFELSKRYNDELWLIENGVFLPGEYTDEDWININNHRWPKIVCDKLNKLEYQFDNTKNLFEADIFDFLIQLVSTPTHLLNEVSHIIYEPQHARNFFNGSMYTPQEMINILEDKSIDESNKKFIYDWLDTFDEDIELEKIFELINFCMKVHSDIKFLFFFFFGVESDKEKRLINRYKSISPNIVEFIIDNDKSTNLNLLLEKSKLKVYQTAFCYTNRIDEFGNEKWKVGEYVDTHAGVRAQSVIADNIIRYIGYTNKQVI
jgi:hypothetical protein